MSRQPPPWLPSFPDLRKLSWLREVMGQPASPTSSRGPVLPTESRRGLEQVPHGCGDSRGHVHPAWAACLLHHEHGWVTVVNLTSPIHPPGPPARARPSRAVCTSRSSPTEVTATLPHTSACTQSYTLVFLRRQLRGDSHPPLTHPPGPTGYPPVQAPSNHTCSNTVIIRNKQETVPSHQ